MSFATEVARRKNAGLVIPWDILFGTQYDMLRAEMIETGALSLSKERVWLLPNRESLERVQVATQSPLLPPPPDPEPSAPDRPLPPGSGSGGPRAITVNRGDLHVVMAEAARLLKSSAPMVPILRMVLLRVEDAQLRVDFTDLGIFACAKLDLTGIADFEPCCVDAVAMERALKPDSKAEKAESVILEKLPDEPGTEGVTEQPALYADDGSLLVPAQPHVPAGRAIPGALIVTCGGAQVKLRTQLPDDYPRVPEGLDPAVASLPQLTWDGTSRKYLLAALDFTLPAMSQDSSRQHLTGIAVGEIFGRYSFMSTDGNRGHIAPVGHAGRIDFQRETHGLLPGALAAFYRRLLNLDSGPALLAWVPGQEKQPETADRGNTPGTWWAATGRWVLRGQKDVEMRVPPPTEHVIPRLDSMRNEPCYTACEMDAVVLAKAIVKCIRPLDRVEGCTLCLDSSGLLLSASDTEGTEASVRCAAQVLGGPSEPSVISINHGFLSQVSKLCDKKAGLHWTGPLDPLLVVGVSGGLDCTAVVMPMRP